MKAGFSMLGDTLSVLLVSLFTLSTAFKACNCHAGAHSAAQCTHLSVVGGLHIIVGGPLKAGFSTLGETLSVLLA